MRKSKTLTMKKLVRFEPSHQGTVRACSVDDCKSLHAHYGYALDDRGGVDKSSKRPVCTEHAR
jgi:hypothetical protein